MRKSSLASVATIALSVGALLCASMLSNKAAAQSSETFINITVVDVKPASAAKFSELAKANSAAAVKEPGCREHNVVKSKADPNHIVIFEVYDSEAAFETQLKGARFKQYQAATESLVDKATPRGQSAIALNSKAH